jgi:hypothetical protein
MPVRYKGREGYITLHLTTIQTCLQKMCLLIDTLGYVMWGGPFPGHRRLRLAGVVCSKIGLRKGLREEHLWLTVSFVHILYLTFLQHLCPFTYTKGGGSV